MIDQPAHVIKSGMAVSKCVEQTDESHLISKSLAVASHHEVVLLN